MIKRKGHKYGLGMFAEHIEIYKDDLGRTQARINNPLIRQAVLDLRSDPHLSALFSAEFQLENKAKEKCYTTGEITRTDMYLAHFLGAHDAVVFINAQKEDPAQSAAALFADAAKYNVNVFYDRRTMRQRSLKEVYDFFGKKFNRGKYDDPEIIMTPAPVKKEKPPKPPRT
jgi:hypothetical protein